MSDLEKSVEEIDLQESTQRLEEINLQDDQDSSPPKGSAPLTQITSKVRQQYLSQGSDLRPSSDARKSFWKSSSIDEDALLTKQKNDPNSVYAKYYRSRDAKQKPAVKNVPIGMNKEMQNTQQSAVGNAGPIIDESEIEDMNMDRQEKRIQIHREQSDQIAIDEDIYDENDPFELHYLEQEESFVNAQKNLEPMDDEQGQKYTIDSFIQSASTVTNTVQSWVDDISNGQIPSLANTSQTAHDKKHKASKQTGALEELLGGSESRLDEILDSVPSRFIDNSKSGLFSLLYDDAKDLDVSSILSKFSSTKNPRELRQILMKTLVGPDYPLQEEKNEIFISTDLTLPELPAEATNDIEAAIDFMIHLCEEKEDKGPDIDRAWWMDKLEHTHSRMSIDDIIHFDFSDSNQARYNISVDKSGEFNENLTTQSNDDDNFNEDHAGDDVDDEMNDGDLDEWEELLWAEARRHYHLALKINENDNETLNETDVIADDDASESRAVKKFRSDLVSCLEAYISSFHCASIDEENEENEFRIPAYVPLKIVKVLIRRTLEAKRKAAQSSDKSGDGDDLIHDEVDFDSYVNAIYSSLFGVNSSFFRLYEIDFSSESDAEKYKNGNPKRKLIQDSHDDQLSDRALVDEFLYGIKPLTEVADGNKNEDLDSSKYEIEVKIYQPFLRFMTKTKFPIDSVSRHCKAISDIVTEMIFDLSMDDGDIVDLFEKGKDVSLISAYLHKHLLEFKVRALVKNYHGEEERNSESIKILKILMDSNFVRRRIKLFGPYVGIQDHIENWQSYVRLGGNISHQNLYDTRLDRLKFQDIHHCLVVELQFYIDCIRGKEKDLSCEEREKENDNVDSLKELLKRRIQNAFRLIEIGRASYSLGLKIGKNEKTFSASTISDGIADLHPESNVADSTSESDFIRLEASDYQRATSSFRQASAILHICKEKIDKLNSDVLPDEELKLEKESKEIRELLVSVDLFLADTFVLKGYCYDTKQREQKSAIGCYKEALRLYRHLGKTHHVVLSAMQNLGSVLFESQEFDAAMTCFGDKLKFLRAIEKSELQGLQQKETGSVIRNNASLQLMKINEDICITLQSLARVYTKVGDVNMAIQYYSEAMQRIKTKRQMTMEQIDPSYFLEESFIEMSGLHMKKAAGVFEEWSQIALTSMFQSSSPTNPLPVAFVYDEAVESQRLSQSYLNESICMRLQKCLKEFDATKLQYNKGEVIHALESMSSEDKEELRSILTRNGLLKFRNCQYESAFVDLDLVFRSFLSDYEETVNIWDMDMKSIISAMEAKFVKNPDSFELIPLIVHFSNLNLRLNKYEDSLMLYTFALTICQEKESKSLISPHARVGVHLDLADIHFGIGYVHSKNGSIQEAIPHLKISLRLLDNIISQNSEEIFSEDDEFILEVFVKLKIVIALNFLSRTYVNNEDATDQALTCVEDSMVILEDVLDEFRVDGSLFEVIKPVKRIVDGSVLQQPMSLLTLGRVLGNNYLRASKLYYQYGLLIDAELAAQKAVRIFDDMKDDSYFSNDHENMVEGLSLTCLNEDLLEASEFALLLLAQSRNNDDQSDDREDEKDAEDIGYDKEDLLFRIGNCYGNLGKHEKALTFLSKAKMMIENAFESNHSNFVLASICQNMATVKRLQYFETFNDETRIESTQLFEESVYLADSIGNPDHDLFIADSMFRVVEMRMTHTVLSPTEMNSLAQDDKLLGFLESSLGTRLRYFGENHADVAIIRYLIGKCLFFKGDFAISLQYINQTLSQWKTLYISMNLDIFDAIFMRGQCQKSLALTFCTGSEIESSEQLKMARLYFAQAMSYSKEFYLSASNASVKHTSISFGCFALCFKCCVEVVGSLKKDLGRGYSISQNLLALIKSFTNSSTLLELDNQIHIFQDLSVRLWNYIADVHNIVENYGTSLIAYETSLGKYPDGISSKDNEDVDVDLLMNFTVATLKLAKQNEVVNELDKAKELYEVVLKNIDSLEGGGTYEKAAVLVYAGILSSSADLLRKAIRIFESDKSLLDPEKILIPGCGQRALMYKFLSYRKMMKGDFKSAWNDISISIATFENIRKGSLRTSAQVVNLEETLHAFENWDLHLFQSYLFQICIAKQIMTGMEFETHTKEIFRKIGILLGDIGSFDLSYHCFYCLLLSLRGDENLAASALLDLASIGNRIDDTPKEILLHEEYIRTTSQLLGLLHRNLLPSLISLAVQNYDDKSYDTAGKWADLGLDSLALNKDLKGESARLLLIKSRRMMRNGAFMKATHYLLQALQGVDSSCLLHFEICVAIGKTFHEQQNIDQAISFFVKSLKTLQNLDRRNQTLEIQLALGEALINKSSLPLASVFFENALILATELKGCDHRYTADALHGLAKSIKSKNEVLSISLFKESVRIYRLLPETQNFGSALYCIGQTLEKERKYEQAGENYKEALKVMSICGENQFLHAQILRSMGFITYRMRNYHAAKKYFQHSVTIFRKVEDASRMYVDSLYWLGCILYLLDEIYESQRTLSAALRCVKRKSENRKEIVLIKLAQSRNFTNLNKRDEAMLCLRDVQQHMKSVSKYFLKNELIKVCLFYGEIYYNLDFVENAVLYTTKAVTLVSVTPSIDFITKEESFQQIIRIYRETGEFVLAREYITQYSQLISELFGHDSDKMAKVLETKGDIEMAMRNVEAATSSYKKALSIHNQCFHSVAECKLLYKQSYAYSRLKCFDEGIKTLDILQDTVNMLPHAGVMSKRANILRASIHFKCNQKDEALRLYTRVLEEIQLLNDTSNQSRFSEGIPTLDIVEMFTNLASYHQNSLKEAGNFLSKAACLCFESGTQLESRWEHILLNLCSLYELLIYSNQSVSNSFTEMKMQLGRMYALAKGFNKAVSIFSEVLAYERKVENQLHVFHTLHNIGSCYIEIGDINNAIFVLNESVQLGEAILGREDTAVADTVYTLAKAYLFSDPIASIDHFQRSLRSRMDNYGINSLEALCTLQDLGNALVQMGKLDAALKVYRDAKNVQLQLKTKDEKKKWNVTNFLLGEALLSKGTYELAMKYLKIFIGNPYKRGHGLQSDIPIALYKIGFIHLKRGENKSAKKYFSKAILEVEEQLQLQLRHHPIEECKSKMEELKLKFADQKLMVAEILQLYGVLLKDSNEYTRSLLCLEFSKAMITSLLGDSSSLRLASIELEIGKIYYEEGEYNRAIEVLTTCLYIKSHLSSEKDMGDLKRIVGLCYSKLGNSEKGLKLIKESNFFNKMKKKNYQSNLEDAQNLFAYGQLQFQRDQTAMAMEVYRRCLSLFQNLSDCEAKENTIVEVTIAIGDAYLKSGGHFKALVNFKQAIFTSRGAQKDVMYKALSNMGDLYLSLGRYDDAIEQYLACVKLQEDFSSDSTIPHQLSTQLYISLGFSYFQLNNYHESKVYYTRAITELKSRYGEYTDIGVCWLKVGQIFMREKDAKKALSCYEHALHIAKSITNNNDFYWNTYQDLGNCLFELEMLQDSQVAYENAMRVAQSLDDISKIAESKYSLSIIMFKIGRVNDALNYCRDALDHKIECITNTEEASSLLPGIDIILSNLRKTTGIGSLEYAEVQEKKGLCLSKANSNTRALAAHKSTKEIYCREYGPDHIKVKTCLYNIALCCIALERWMEARQCLLQMYKKISSILGNENIELANIQFYIGLTHQKTENWKEAKKCLDDSIYIRKVHGQYHKKLTAETLDIIGDIVNEQKNSLALQASEMHYLESMRLYTNLHMMKEAAMMHYKIAKFYAAKDKYEKALVHLEKSLVTFRVLTGGLKSPISDIYLSLGNVHEALNQVERAIACYDFCIKSSKTDIVATKAFINKGKILCRNSKYEEALLCLSTALQIGVDGSKQEIEAEVLVARGQVSDLMNKHDLALESYQNALEIYKKLPKCERDVATVCQEIANFHIRKKQYREAFRFSEEALDIRQKELGLQNKLTAETLYSKGNILFALGEHKQALSCLELALYNLRKVRATSLMKANSAYLLGCTQESIGQYDKAFQSLKESLTYHDRANKEGNGSIKDTSRTLRRLGACHKSRKEYMKARELFQKSLSISIPEYGPENIEIAKIHDLLAETLCLEDRDEEALQHLLLAMKIYKIYNDPKILGRVYCLQGIILEKINDELQAVRNAYKLSRDQYLSVPEKEKTDVDKIGLASTYFKLASVEDRNGRFTSASKNYLKANDIYIQALKSKNTLYSADVYERLANLNGRLKKFDKAIALLEEAFRIRVEILGADHEAVAQALFSLGIIFSKQNEVDAALKAFTDCLSIRQIKCGVDSIATADTLHAIGRCLGNAGDFTNALNLWNEAVEIYARHEQHEKVISTKRDLDLGYKLSQT